jgi:hypothetical protein
VTKFGLTVVEGYQGNKDSVTFNTGFYVDIIFRSHLQSHIYKFSGRQYIVL